MIKVKDDKYYDTFKKTLYVNNQLPRLNSSKSLDIFIEKITQIISM